LICVLQGFASEGRLDLGELQLLWEMIGSKMSDEPASSMESRLVALEGLVSSLKKEVSVFQMSRTRGL